MAIFKFPLHEVRIDNSDWSVIFGKIERFNIDSKVKNVLLSTAYLFGTSLLEMEMEVVSRVGALFEGRAHFSRLFSNQTTVLLFNS